MNLEYLLLNDLADKTALVTGASSGLGAHFATVLARAGARVILAARRQDALQDRVKKIVTGGGKASAVCLDVTNADSVKALGEVLGDVDIVVNNAGLVRDGPALDQSEANWDLGYFDTELNRAFWDSESGKAMIRRIPQRRLGSLEDLNGPLLLLASDASRYMTGSVLTVDGGHLVSSL